MAQEFQRVKRNEWSLREIPHHVAVTPPSQPTSASFLGVTASLCLPPSYGDYAGLKSSEFVLVALVNSALSKQLPGDKEFVSWQQDLEDSVKPTQQARPTVIRWSEGGKEVFLSGSFNNWSTKIPLIKSHNDFVAILDLPEGEHQYKFFVDGQWVHDPSEPVVTSQLGTINNLIHVEKSDFEVFDALKLDSMESSETSCRDLSSSPPGPYGQEMYVFRSEERFKSPPILPPHLLQVILNKDTNISCDPALLPEPNHVMLNHLYTLSIKDSVMVLSATHRYKKKYVTTLLYKPI
ncbi:PREDICTED: 5'-AMP-activated protein kinase subunit beta-2 [Condylura cristata]|uniref:5'-AMP-activated protein kinase subunit beta-2 n=1 Tax=Condylura cristata TaxID=143302 RepID=UPI00033466E6|nr:PREDICTED: 5'-AMP-activated protein kinase subunit beta-2 [Condylura cristata]